ncbi:pentatricopeptide repeat-containing protein At1g62350-like isoform X2 [Malania oleifera]|uniref:pentatricopeptide repeat-containing protein At1g62350-like isoform X2 n=1 Tax=Malania oleifera TaxID=397392 RepID=UPI0025AE5BA8|nr:pentatricopeptide repeat-containing protein At1g62350-like isoform X2 [Malania oleifera]
MGSLGFQFSELGFNQNLEALRLPRLHHTAHLHSSSFTSIGLAPRTICGLRRKSRKHMWRSRVLSTEAIQAVQSLKLAKPSSSKLEEVFNTRLKRLLKADLLGTLVELQRQNDLDLALKVFEFVRKEVWYKPDLYLYCDMIQMLGKNKLIEKAEELFFELKKEGLEPNTRAYTEMIGAFLQVGMVENAMETYGLMKASGCIPDELTLTILIRNLEKARLDDLAASVKKECVDYVDSPEKFLKEVSSKYVRRCLDLV